MHEHERITLPALAEALGCTERNVRAREGTTLPEHIQGPDGREYCIIALLWTVGGREREQLMGALGLDATGLYERWRTALEGLGKRNNLAMDWPDEFFESIAALPKSGPDLAEDEDDLLLQ